MTLDLPDADLTLFRHFLLPARADQLFTALRDSVAWQAGTVRIAGRSYPMPRLQAWYGDPGAKYRYSGMWLQPLPWLPMIDELRPALGDVAGANFNSVLVNLYRDGRDSVSWHSDNEKRLGPEPVIASLSLGATRRFDLAHRSEKRLKASIELDNGSLLIMKGATQRCWKHQVPKQPRVGDARINLTFRFVETS
jgi:alkylated DNA repair dioxygenase AlkB